MPSWFSTQARFWLNDLCPHYAGYLESGFTSLRPIEIAKRVTSWPKDDTRLHVDALPSAARDGGFLGFSST